MLQNSRVKLLLPILAMIVLFTLSLPAQNAELLRNNLREHGVATTPLGLGRFLTQGWKGAEPPDVLPSAPPEKTTLLYQAWVLLTLEYREVAKQPELLEQIGYLSRYYATGDLPEGANRIIAEDIRGLDPTTRARAERVLKELLQYNGMVALGFFGTRDDKTREAARKVYEETQNPSAKVAVAQTLAMLGDDAIIGDLVEIAARGNRGPSVQAARTLELLTGKVFDLNANLAIGPRKQAASRIEAWWEKEKDEIHLLEREDIIYRLLNPPPKRRAPMNSLRDLLRAASDKTDMTDERGSRTAWRRLNDLGEDLAEELEPILEDEDEDLDIRAEAIRWYVRIEGVDDAKRRLKKMRKDPNPEIAAMAREILEED